MTGLKHKVSDRKFTQFAHIARYKIGGAMDFYVLKKKDELIAIPANEQHCKQYLDNGYFYIDKVAACDENTAIRRLKAKYQRNMRLPLTALAIAIPVIIVTWWQVTH